MVDLIGAIGDGVDALESAAGGLVDLSEDLASGAIDMADAILERADELLENGAGWMEDRWEDIEDFAEDMERFAEEAAEATQERWEAFEEGLEDFLADLADALDEAWNRFVNDMEAYGEWLKDQVDSAVDWLIAATDAVLSWVVDDLIPAVISLIKLHWVIAKLLGGLLALAMCWIASQFTEPEEVSVMKAVTERHPRMLAEFRIEELPVEANYAVFSDHHLFVDGEYNFYENLGNAAIHRWALMQYAGMGYSVIDNGDVEDFWMRGGSAKGHILDIADTLPYPYHYAAYVDAAATSAFHAHAVNVFIDNAATYSLVDQLFVANGRYARTIGNHDDVWDRTDMQLLFDFVYQRPVVANDYILLEDSDTKETRFLIGHGHQADIFNMQLCDYAGKLVTEAFSEATEVSPELLGRVKKFQRSKQEWSDELNYPGFTNQLADFDMSKFVSMDETELYDEIEDEYHDDPAQPHLVLGHTHNIKHDAVVPGAARRVWREYSNTGTTGMWEECVTCLEILHGTVMPMIWRLDENNRPRRYLLVPGPENAYLI